MLKTRKDTILEITYLACFSIYFICSLIIYSPLGLRIAEYVTHKTLFTVLNWAVFAVLAVIYVFKHHESKKEIAAELFIVALFSVVTYTTQTVKSIFHLNQWTFLFTTGMFIACATVTTLKRISVTTLGTSLAMFVFFNTLSFTKVVPEFTASHAGATAHFLGYFYYTHPSFYMLFAWLIYMYLRGEKKIGWIELLVELAALYRLHRITTCRLGIVATFVAFIFYVIFVKLELIKMEWKITKFAAASGFGLAAAFTLITGYFYNAENVILSKINGLLSGRLYLVCEAFKRYDINLFGRLISPAEGEGYYYLDSSYAYDLFGCGVIFFIVVLFIHSYLLYDACRKKDKALFVWLATLLVFTMINDVWVNISYCPLILSFFIVLRENKAAAKLNAVKDNPPADNT